MLEEAVDVIRKLWQGGIQSHRGRHYVVENARVYDLPEQTPPILVSGFGPSRSAWPAASAMASARSRPIATRSRNSARRAAERSRSPAG